MRQAGYSQEAAVVAGSAANLLLQFGGQRPAGVSGYGNPVDVSAPKEPPRPRGCIGMGNSIAAIHKKVGSVLRPF
jgi:hypothetical protein